MNPEVTSYINKAPIEQKLLMQKVRKLIHDSVPDVIEEFKWSRPVFKSKKDFAYFKTTKAYLTLGFFHFQKLKDEKNLLEGTGKDMRHIKLKTEKDLDEKLLKEWFKISSVAE